MANVDCKCINIMYVVYMDASLQGGLYIYIIFYHSDYQKIFKQCWNVFDVVAKQTY